MQKNNMLVDARKSPARPTSTAARKMHATFSERREWYHFACSLLDRGLDRYRDMTEWLIRHVTWCSCPHLVVLTNSLYYIRSVISYSMLSHNLRDVIVAAIYIYKVLPCGPCRGFWGIAPPVAWDKSDLVITYDLLYRTGKPWYSSDQPSRRSSAKWDCFSVRHVSVAPACQHDACVGDRPANDLCWRTASAAWHRCDVMGAWGRNASQFHAGFSLVKKNILQPISG